MCSKNSPADQQMLQHRTVTLESSARGCQEELVEDFDLKINDKLLEG
jgi:hypothetical protein